MLPEREGDRFRAVPGGDDDGPLDRHGVDRGLQGRSRPAGLDRYVRAPPRGRGAHAGGQIVAGIEHPIDAHGARQLPPPLQGIDRQHATGAGALQKLRD